MKKRLRTSLLWFLVLSSLIIDSCQKQKYPYDLFPLKAGNEYYYKYEKREIAADTKGIEAWKVLSESSQGGTVSYMIERKLNAIVAIGVLI